MDDKKFVVTVVVSLHNKDALVEAARAMMPSGVVLPEMKTKHALETCYQREIPGTILHGITVKRRKP